MNKLLVILIIFLTSCAGTRNVKKNKNEETSAQESSGENFVKIDSEIKITGENIFKKTDDLKINSFKLLSESRKDESYGTANKINIESSKKTFRNTEYYENGNKKSETESSEDYNKLSNERDYWKASAEAIKETSEKKDVQILSLTNSNIKLNTENSKLSEEKKSYSDKLESSKKESSNKTERDFMSVGWYVLTFILGMLSTGIIQGIWKKIKASQWYYFNF